MNPFCYDFDLDWIALNNFSLKQRGVTKQEGIVIMLRYLKAPPSNIPPFQMSRVI